MDRQEHRARLLATIERYLEITSDLDVSIFEKPAEVSSVPIAQSNGDGNAQKQ
jgi:hypothetical protein